MYKTITLAALSTLLFMSCEKENIDETITPQKPTTIVEILNESKHRGQDDEILVKGSVRTNNGQTNLVNGTIKVFDTKMEDVVNVVSTDDSGNFIAPVRKGDYLLRCYDNEVFIGTSETLRVEGDTKVTIIF